jgi:hypothetical protein
MNTAQIEATLYQLASSEILGKTCWFSPVEKISGYVVGNGNKGLVFEYHSWTDDMHACAMYLQGTFESWYAYKELTGQDGFGFWVDGGKLYVDPVVHVTDKTQAICMGIAYKEQAIWDITQQDTINMKDYTLQEVSHA